MTAGAPPVEPAAITRWLDALGPALRGSRWRDALTVDGIDVLDASRSFLYSHLLKLTRAGSGRPLAPPVSLAKRVRSRLALAIRHQRARLLSARPARADVVLWPRERNHWPQQVAVAAALRTAGMRALMVASIPSMIEEPRTAGARPFYTWASWAPFLKRAQRRGGDLVGSLARPPAAELPAFPAPIAEERILEALRFGLGQTLPGLCEALATTDLVVTRLHPRVIVVGNDLTLEGRTASLRARSHGVATACLSHGVASGNPLESSHQADKLLVYGEITRRHLLAAGVDPRQVEVVGAPHLDSRPRQTGRKDPAVRRLLPRDRPWILVATSGPGMSVSHEHHGRIIRAILRATLALPEVDFIAKLHPKDARAHYQQALAEVPGRLIIVEHGAAHAPPDFWAWLQGPAALITGGSTAAVDGMIMGVPVVTVDLAADLTKVDFITAGATHHVTAEADLVAVLRRLVAGPDPALQQRADAFLGELYFGLDGNSAQRAAAVIQGLAARGAGSILGIR